MGKLYFLTTVILSSLVLTQPALAEIILPGGCQMGECWDSKFVGKELLRTGNKGTLYSVTLAGRSWKMEAQPPNNFEKIQINYVYCSKSKPALIFKNDDGTYYAHLLNPGGDWYGYNQSDYPVYWATCHNFVGPEFFSEQITTRAVKLGYSLHLASEQIELKNPFEIME